MSTRLPVITLKCKHCGYTDKRRRDDTYTGHSFNDGFSYVCPSCNANLDVVEEKLSEDVRTNDPVIVQKVMSQQKCGELPYPFKVWKLDRGATFVGNLENMIETLKEMSAKIPDDVEHFPFQMNLHNAKWSLIAAKYAWQKITGEIS